MTAPIAPLRSLSLSVMSAPLFIALALWFVFTDDRFASPEPWAAGIVAVAGAVAAVAVLSVGFRSVAIKPGTPSGEAARTAALAFQSGTILRFALSELPMIVALVLAFVVTEGGYLTYLLGMAIALVLMLLFVLPSDSSIARAQRSLEREGAVVPLREHLYADPAPRS